MNANQIFIDALTRAKALNSGTTFILADLFTGIEWASFNSQERKKAGSLFLNDCLFNNSASVIVGGKTSANHQMYEKK